MILNLKDGCITIKQDTIEETSNANIIMKFQDKILKSSDIVKLYINDKIVEKKQDNFWKLSPGLLDGKSHKIAVVLNDKDIYTTTVQLKAYFSMKQIENFKCQVNQDLLSRIEKIEKEIQQIKNKGTVI